MSNYGGQIQLISYIVLSYDIVLILLQISLCLNNGNQTRWQNLQCIIFSKRYWCCTRNSDSNRRRCRSIHMLSQICCARSSSPWHVTTPGIRQWNICHLRHTPTGLRLPRERQASQILRIWAPGVRDSGPISQGIPRGGESNLCQYNRRQTWPWQQDQWRSVRIKDSITL